jgi:5-methylthioribose kinase
MPGNLDIEQPEQLVAYLRRTGRIGANETPVCRVLAGGVSNRTVLVERPSGEAWVMKQALEKLRVKADWFSSPLRIHREAMGLRHLEKLAPAGAITPLIFEDDEFHLLAMAAVPQPHENWKTMLLKLKVDRAEQIKPLNDQVEQFATLLAKIHLGAMQQRDTFKKVFEDRSFFESLRLEPYYQYTANQVPESKAFLESLIADTRENRYTIVHGDYSPKNILVYQGRLVLLDHEVIHFGDGAFDVGFALAHFLSKANYFSKRHLPNSVAFKLAAFKFWGTYLHIVGKGSGGDQLQARAARHTLGCLFARVAGRSPLEYLNEEERMRQQKIVVKMMLDPPELVDDVIYDFVEELITKL